MSATRKFIDLSRSHDDYAVDFVRMFLGVALFVRGAIFIGDSSRILRLVEAAGIDEYLTSILLYVVILTHLLGGIMLVFGLLTQFAALIQIPVLSGALVISIVQGGPFMPDQSFELSAMVLLLLAIILRMGSGRLSLDYLIFVQAEQSEAKRRLRLEKLTADLKKKVALSDQLRKEELDLLHEEIDRHEKSLGHYTSSLASNIAIVGKYVVSAGVGGVVLVLAIQALPFDVSAAEMAVVSALLFAIVGFFFFFFSWALRED